MSNRAPLNLTCTSPCYIVRTRQSLGLRGKRSTLMSTAYNNKSTMVRGGLGRDSHQGAGMFTRLSRVCLSLFETCDAPSDVETGTVKLRSAAREDEEPLWAGVVAGDPHGLPSLHHGHWLLWRSKWSRQGLLGVWSIVFLCWRFSTEWPDTRYLYNIKWWFTVICAWTCITPGLNPKQNLGLQSAFAHLTVIAYFYPNTSFHRNL